MHCILVNFAGGVIASRGEGGTSILGVGGVGDGKAGVGREIFLPAGVVTAEAAMTEEGEQTRLVPTAVAAQSRHRGS